MSCLCPYHSQNRRPLPQPCNVLKIDLSKNVQKEPWFLEINPNACIPALTTSQTGRQIRVFESGSILEYLAEQHDKDHKISYIKASRESYEMRSWMYFQNAGQGNTGPGEPFQSLCARAYRIWYIQVCQ